MSRRDQIRMTGPEARAFLEESRTVTVATQGPRGFPHLMPLWYVLRGEEIWGWTYGSSQKVKNLERDPRATLQVEAGTTYDQLRGLVLECDVTLHRGTEDVASVGLELARRYGGVEPDEGAVAAVTKQAAKRVALQFTERHRVSWDHRKLGGKY